MDYHQPSAPPRFLLLDANGSPIGAARSLDEAVCPEGGGILDQETDEYFDEGEALRDGIALAGRAA